MAASISRGEQVSPGGVLAAGTSAGAGRVAAGPLGAASAVLPAATGVPASSSLSTQLVPFLGAAGAASGVEGARGGA